MRNHAPQRLWARPEGVGTTFPYEVFKQFAATSASSAELLACAPLPNAHAVVDGQAAIVSAVVASGNYHQVMGVVTDSRYNSLREPTPPTMYVPFSQFAKPSAFVQIRTAGNQLLLLASVREGVRQVDPDLPLANVYAQVDQIERRPAEKKVLRAPASSWLEALRYE